MPHRLVAERREGRHVFYRLLEPELATWVAAGLGFVKAAQAVSKEIVAAADASLKQRGGPPQA